MGESNLGDVVISVSETTTRARGARYIDPAKEDYANQQGVILRTTTLVQRVTNLLLTEFGSSLAMRGMRYPELHDETTQQITSSEVRAALEVLTSTGEVVIEAVSVATEADRVPGRLGITVELYDTISDLRPPPISV